MLRSRVIANMCWNAIVCMVSFQSSAYNYKGIFPYFPNVFDYDRAF